MVQTDEERKAKEKARKASPEYKAREKARKASPEYKAREKARKASPEYKAREKARKASPEYKAREKARKASPEYKAREKARKASPEYKAREKARKASPEYKAREKALRSTPEYKAKQKALQSTPEYKAKQKVYRNKPEYKAKQKALQSTPEYKAKQKVYRNKPEYKAKQKARKATPKRKKRIYHSFEDAREFVRGLNLKNDREWKQYCRTGSKPEDIPGSPHTVYKDKGWKGLGDWLGTGTVGSQNLIFRSFEDAREFIMKLNLQNRKTWDVYKKSGSKPEDIPGSPHTVYKDKGWKGWGDFLRGNNNKIKRTPKREKKIYRSFEDAREFVRDLNLKNYREWNQYCKSGNKPADIPNTPNIIYKGKGWNGIFDWLSKFMQFEDAREFVRKLEIKDTKEWNDYAKSGNKPADIPSNPSRTYKIKWKGMKDWLGTSSLSEFRTFHIAREFAKELGLSGVKNWKQYCRTGNRPTDIPSDPSRTYKKEWKGWGDWLGTGNKRPGYVKYRSFKNAREFVKQLGLSNQNEWIEYAKSGNKPADIPSKPSVVYQKKWKGIQDWLGVTGFNKHYAKPFRTARTFVRSLNLKSGTEWRKYVKSKDKPDYMPATPDQFYKKEWKGWGDWLGTGTIANRERDILSYNEAEEKAHRICKRLEINSPKEWETAYREGKIPKSLPSSPQFYYQIKRGIAKNVENEYYTTWFKFSGTSTKWTEEVAWHEIKKLAKLCYEKRFRIYGFRGITCTGTESELLTSLYMILNTDHVFKDTKHKIKFVEMLNKLPFEKLEIKGKSKMYIENEILFFYAHFYFLDHLRNLPANHHGLIRNVDVDTSDILDMDEKNDNFKEVDDEFEIEEEQVCMVVMDDDTILAGYFEEPESTSEDKDDPLWIPSLDLQGCHKSEDGGKTWVRVAGNEGMSYCELDRDHVLGIYIPKKELGLDACMELWS